MLLDVISATNIEYNDRH